MLPYNLLEVLTKKKFLFASKDGRQGQRARITQEMHEVSEVKLSLLSMST